MTDWVSAGLLEGDFAEGNGRCPLLQWGCSWSELWDVWRFSHLGSDVVDKSTEMWLSGTELRSGRLISCVMAMNKLWVKKGLLASQASFRRAMRRCYYWREWRKATKLEEVEDTTSGNYVHRRSGLMDGRAGWLPGGVLQPASCSRCWFCCVAA